MRKKIVFLPYDFDSAIGINNEGDPVFDYSLEDTDQTQSGADVYNGQDSVLWNNMRKMFFKELQLMYQNLRSTGALSYAKIEKAFEDHQNKWGEAIFNEDMQFKCIDPLVNDGDGTYLAMMRGSKTEHRKWWLYNRFKYIDSKYNAGDALSDYIQLRGYAKADITVTPYADIYPTIKYGSYLVQTRGKRNRQYTLECPVDTLNDTEIYIYSASQLASVGDLSGLKVGLADFSRATKMQDIKLGDSDPNYDNGNLKTLSLGNNVLLRSLDVRNCSGLGNYDMKAPDISGCTNIENVYFDGTNITGVVLPNGGILKVLHLPATVTNLTIRNQRAITDFTIPSYANITSLWLDNVSSAVDSKAILNAISAGSRVRLINVAWEAVDAAEILALFDTLDTMRGLDEYGNNMETAQVSGTIHTTSLSGPESTAISARLANYPYLNVTADHTSTTRTFKTWDGSETVGTVIYVDGVAQSSIPSVPSRSQTNQYTYTGVGWATTQDAQNADMSTTCTMDDTVYAAYSRTVRTYTVTWKNADGTILETDTNVAYGSWPSYNGATPTYNGQTSKGWTPSISSVTGNVTYTASYIPVYTVKFYNRTVLLETVSVQQGSNATYSGATPVDAENGYPFDGWSPSPTNIQANTNCYAQFKAPWEVAEISDTWDQIIAACANGTHTSKYKPGNYKPLDLGAQGIVNMQIVAMNKDALASGGGTAPLTLIAMTQLSSTHRWNPSRATDPEDSSKYLEGTGTIGGWEKSEIRTYMRETIKPLIPANVRSAIKEVTKYSRIYNTSSSAVNNVATTDDVWIPCRQEVFGNYSSESNAPYYDSAFPDNASRVRQRSGSASWWWLRSAGSYNFATGVGSDGSYNYAGVDYAGGVVVGFCI